MSAAERLQEKIKTRKARVGVVGLGYVGLPPRECDSYADAIRLWANGEVATANSSRRRRRQERLVQEICPLGVKWRGLEKRTYGSVSEALEQPTRL